jgi:hypothetical protein
MTAYICPVHTPMECNPDFAVARNPNISVAVQAPTKVMLDQFPEYIEDFIDLGDVLFSPTFSRAFPLSVDKNVDHPGYVCPTWARDYLNRIHIYPNRIDLGNVLSTQEKDITVWNSYSEDRSLASVVGTGTDGFTLLHPESPPTTFKKFEERVYHLSVDVAGDSVIAAEYTFSFDVVDVLLIVTGKRIIVWGFVPETSMIEAVEWKTDIIQCKSTEQRIAVRQEPRRSFTHKYVMEDYEFGQLKVSASGHGYRQYGVPVWSDYKYIGDIASGETVISIPTDSTMFTIGELAIIYQDTMTHESSEIVDMDATSITLAVPLTRGFLNAYVMPIVFANLMEGVKVSRTKDMLLTGTANFLCTAPSDIAYTNKTQLRGYDLLLDRSVMVSAVSERIEREVNVFDDMVGSFALYPKKTYYEYDQSLTFDTLTMEDLYSVKQWLYTLKGKQKGFFLPTWNSDYRIVTEILGTDTSITVHNSGSYLYPSVRDILIVKKDGTYLLTQILSSVINVDGDEALFLSTAVGEDITLSNFSMICEIHYVRLNTDRIEIKHRTGRAATITVPIVRIPEP